MWKSFLAAGLLALVLAQPVSAQPESGGAPPGVVVSIKPLHGLVAAVMRGVGEPGLIVAGNASPHTYALRPSDAGALQRAKLVVWVGKDFEGFLTRALGGRTDTIAMESLPGMTLLPTREGGVWEEESDHHGDEHGGVDGHLWLDPGNAARLVTAVAARLEELDPAHAATYAANAADARQRLDELDAGMAAELKPLAGRSYVVFHDAFHYLEHRYGLTPAGSITVDPERPPSARRMAALRDRLKAGGATCVFREPQFAGATVQALADSAGARVALLDPEGTAVAPGPDAYFTLMQAIARSLSECLSGR